MVPFAFPNMSKAYANKRNIIFYHLVMKSLMSQDLEPPQLLIYSVE